MAFWAEQGGSLVMYRQEPRHDFLTPPRVAVGGLGTIVEPLVLAMFYARGQFCLRDAMRSRFVRNDDAWLAPGFEQLPEKAQRCRLVPSRLNQNIEDVTVGVDRPPKPP